MRRQASEQPARVLAFQGARHKVVSLALAQRLAKDGAYALVRYAGARALERCSFRPGAPFAHDLAGAVRETCFLVERARQRETEALLFGGGPEVATIEE